MTGGLDLAGDRSFWRQINDGMLRLIASRHDDDDDDDGLLVCPSLPES